MQMQMDEEDELGWKALGVNVGMHGAGVGAGGMVGEVHDVVGAGVGVELGNGRSDIPVPDTDDEAFPKLDDDIAYDSRDASLRHSDASDGGVVRSASLRSASQNAQPKKPQRFKRKNFSKRLQLLCLQRYAEFAKENSNLPSKQECQFLLNQSYMEFVKEGGSTDEPRLTYQEFLKLIRNRRREMYVRASKQKFTEQDLQALTPAKRKLQLEHAKIQEYITIIDQTREQSNITHDKHRSSLLRQRTAINLSLQHQMIK
ncbi:TPA: hypothetical protein N0F65_006361 [Lagenidium giganteum]|uniref:Uncharacterized protein n=1 Tax=Lagenidium giganteum TaxID=4803 RepID=A0AAV2YUH4_9STRA|nr:TPA: hypothetical protein N0F65_006361 [Lagenidium giganteum]